MTLEGSQAFRITRGNGRPSTKEKGGLPEDSRQKVNTMEAVAENDVKVKPVAIKSVDSPDKKAGNWLEAQIGRSKAEGVFTQTIELDPPLARALLNRNPDNRKLSVPVLYQYINDMKNHAWKFNGEPIIVSSDGHLNDGQHRCEAVIRADVEIPALIVFGVQRETRTTVDQGKSRSAGDYLAMNGVANAIQIATIASFILQYSKVGSMIASPKHRPTRGEVFDFVIEHPAVIVSYNAIKAIASRQIGGTTILGALHYLFQERAGKHRADDFMGSLLDGAGLKIGNPILYVRNRLITEGGRLRQNERAELLIKAWNAHRAGQTVKMFNITGELPKISS